jgi:hypothetical protein
MYNNTELKFNRKFLIYLKRRNAFRPPGCPTTKQSITAHSTFHLLQAFSSCTMIYELPHSLRQLTQQELPVTAALDLNLPRQAGFAFFSTVTAFFSADCKTKNSLYSQLQL